MGDGTDRATPARAGEKPFPIDPHDPARRTIVFRDGDLWIEGGHILPVRVGRRVIAIGCTTMTLDAWSFLQREVNDLLDSAASQS
jgi:hypothetical protein